MCIRDRKSIEPRETRRVLRELFNDYRLKYRLENEMAEELAFIIEDYETEWLELYKMRVKLMTTKVCHIINHLEEATVKLEELRGIEEKYWTNVKLKRMRYRHVTQLVCGGVSKGITVGLVDPRGTSSECPICRSRLRSHGWETKYCPICRREWNRDIVAGILISVSPVRILLKPPMKVKTRGGALTK